MWDMKRLWKFSASAIPLLVVAIGFVLAVQPEDSSAPSVRRTPHGVMFRVESFTEGDQEALEALTAELLRAGLTQAEIDRIREEISRRNKYSDGG